MMEIIDAGDIDASDPHGYCRQQIKRPAIDFQEQFRIPWKRANLGNEIRELHIMNEARVIPPTTTGYFNKELICKLIDDMLDVQKVTPGHLWNVKRQLFRKIRETSRKSIKVSKNKKQISTAFNFRFIRAQIGCRKIKRNYLEKARLNILEQIKTENTSQRRPSSTSIDSGDTISTSDSKKYRHSNEWSKDSSGMLHIKTDDGTYPVSPIILAKICKFHDKMVRHHPLKKRTEYEQTKRNLNTKACRLSRRVSKLASLIVEEQYRERAKMNSKVVEHSLRSIHYLKSLLDVINKPL